MIKQKHNNYYKDNNRFYLDYNHELFSNTELDLSSNIELRCNLKWDDKIEKVIKITTNTIPSFLHFPGKNKICYDHIIKQLFDAHNLTY